MFPEQVAGSSEYGLCTLWNWTQLMFGYLLWHLWLSPVSYVPGGADDNLIEGGEMKFVCKPGARNITVIFQPLLRYSTDWYIQSKIDWNVVSRCVFSFYRECDQQHTKQQDACRHSWKCWSSESQVKIN